MLEEEESESAEPDDPSTTGASQTHTHGTRAVVNTTLSWKFHPTQQRYARPCGVWKIVKFVGSFHLESR